MTRPTLTLQPPPTTAPKHRAGPTLADQPLGLDLPRRQLPTTPLAAGRPTPTTDALPLAPPTPTDDTGRLL